LLFAANVSLAETRGGRRPLNVADEILLVPVAARRCRSDDDATRLAFEPKVPTLRDAIERESEWRRQLVKLFDGFAVAHIGKSYERELRLHDPGNIFSYSDLQSDPRLSRLTYMSNTVHSDSDFRDEFIEGAARAFFVTAYADFVEDPEREQGAYDYLAASCGADWMDCAPETTPPNAYALAGELWGALYHLNGKAGVYTLALNAEAADGQPVDAKEFGHYLAMAAMGHGVSWFDDHADFPLETPYMECSGFTFDERAYRE